MQDYGYIGDAGYSKYRKQVQNDGYRIQNTRVQGEDWMQDRDAVCTIQK
jgi:hypothetical protein